MICTKLWGIITNWGSKNFKYTEVAQKLWHKSNSTSTIHSQCLQCQCGFKVRQILSVTSLEAPGRAVMMMPVTDWIIFFHCIARFESVSGSNYMFCIWSCRGFIVAIDHVVGGVMRKEELQFGASCQVHLTAASCCWWWADLHFLALGTLRVEAMCLEADDNFIGCENRVILCVRLTL